MKIAEKRVWTYKDYLKIRDDKRYEIIEGEIQVAPAPTTLHQAVLMTLYKMMDGNLKDGIILIAPVDVVLSEKNVVQPDIVVVSKERKDIIEERGIFGSPDLVVEIVSPGSFERDTEIKRELYARHGIEEYWIVFPKEELVEVLALSEDRYTLLVSSERSEKICSHVFKGLCIDSKELFENAKKYFK